MEDDESCLPTLEEVEREFLNGRSYGWSSRSVSEYHKVSASNEWYKYRGYLLDYPGTLEYAENAWRIKTVGCGKRNRTDTMLLYRVVPLSYVIEKSNNFAWTTRFARDEDNNCFYEIERLSVRYFAEEGYSQYDKCFAAWHRDSLLKANGLIKDTPPKEVTEEMRCKKGCRPSHCYCTCEDKKLSYEVNEHSMEVDITHGFRTISLTLDEATELASFLATAKEEIKQKKIAALQAQQEELKKQLESVQNM